MGQMGRIARPLGLATEAARKIANEFAFSLALHYLCSEKQRGAGRLRLYPMNLMRIMPPKGLC